MSEKATIYTIYRLVDPRNNAPRYVGLTTGLEARYKEHIAGHRSTDAVYTWIEELKMQGLRPLMQVVELIEATTQEQARQRETAWIQHHARLGAPLLNVIGMPVLKAKGDSIDKFTGVTPFRSPWPV